MCEEQKEEDRGWMNASVSRKEEGERRYRESSADLAREGKGPSLVRSLTWQPSIGGSRMGPKGFQCSSPNPKNST